MASGNACKVPSFFVIFNPASERHPNTGLTTSCLGHTPEPNIVPSILPPYSYFVCKRIEVNM